MDFQSYLYPIQCDRPVLPIKPIPMPILKQFPNQRRSLELEITMRPV